MDNKNKNTGAQQSQPTDNQPQEHNTGNNKDKK